MQEGTGFGLKGCSSLPGLGWKYFNNLREKNDEPSYTFNHKYKRWFVRQSIKRRLVCAYKQDNSSKSCDKPLMCSAKEIKNVFESSTTYSIFEKFFKYRDRYKKISEREYITQFQDYRDNIIDDKKTSI